MDYKYIEQLLERYWECQTTLEEESILRAFFSQDDIPVSMMQYRDLFVYEQKETKNDVLGDDFDTRIMARIEKEPMVKAQRIRLTQRLYPIFKAAAIVAIILTLGNAIQKPFMMEEESPILMPGYTQSSVQEAVVKTDTMKIDSMQRSQTITVARDYEY